MLIFFNFSKSNNRYCFLVILVLLILLSLSNNALAENTTKPASSPKNLLTKNQPEEPKPTGNFVLPDSFGRNTPRGTVQGFLKALAIGNEQLAGKYLQIQPGDNSNTLVRKFKKALDAGGHLQSDLQVSNEEEGDLTDKLNTNQEKVGFIEYQGKNVYLKLIRIDENGSLVWVFSQETLKKIPEIAANTQPTIVQQYSAESLSKTKLFDMYLSDVIAVILLTLIGFAIVYLLVWLFYLSISVLYPAVRKKALPITDNIILPLAVAITSLLLPDLMVWVGVSVTLRESVTHIVDIFAWGSLNWLLFRLVDSTFGRVEQHSHKHKRVEQIAIIGLMRKLVKVTLIIIAIIVVFGNLGFDLTTGIATLGLGGLALALGAQKTVENLVGSVVVVVDRPVRVGDYCRFGSYEGIVLEIGIRSTRVRTFERSIVTIPNGDFASMQIENFTAKDMFRFLHLLYIKRTCDIKTIHKMLRELDTFLNEHYLTNQEWNQVRISELRQDCYVVECQAYINANSRPEFYDKQNVVIFDLLKEVDKYEVEHALPTQQLLLEKRIISNTNHEESYKE